MGGAWCVKWVPWLLLSFAVCREAISVFEGCWAVISRRGRLVWIDLSLGFLFVVMLCCYRLGNWYLWNGLKATLEF